METEEKEGGGRATVFALDCCSCCAIVEWLWAWRRDWRDAGDKSNWELSSLGGICPSRHFQQFGAGFWVRRFCWL